MSHEPGHQESFADILAAIMLLPPDERAAILGTDTSKGLPSKPEAIQAGIAAGVPNPGVVTFNNEWFYTDPAAPPPKGTWANEEEARAFAISINRADLVPVFDSKTGLTRLEEPPPSTPTGPPIWIPEVGKFEVTLADGRIQLVDPAQASEATAAAPFGSTPIPGTDFVLVNDGQGGTSIVAKAELQEEQPQGEVVNIDGRQFIRDVNGNLQPLGEERTPSIDEMVSKALLAGDIDGAIALSDFRDRPNSMELFQAALAFAQSPGDTAAISAIARGETLVEPGPPGSVQRIAAQPEFLQDQFQKLMGRFRDGGGTPNDIVSALQDASNRMREDQDTAAKANQALADNEQKERDRKDAEFEKRFQDLSDEFTLFRKAADPTAGTPKGLLDTPPSPPPPSFEDTIFSRVGKEAIEGPGFGPGAVPAAPPVPLPPPRFEDTVFSRLDEGAIEGPIAAAPPPAPRFEDTIFSRLNEDDFFAGGGVFDDSTAIVGEAGPELLIAAPGARVIPLEGDDLAKLKTRVQGMAHGGVLDSLLPHDAPAPVDSSLGVFGVRQVLRGGSLEPTRRRLSTGSGLPVLSGQSRKRLLPSELSTLDTLRGFAGISREDFEQEQLSAVPGGRVSRASRFAARVAR